MIARLFGALIMVVFLLSSCNSSNKKMLEAIELMQSTPISIPYNQMACWSSDSLLNTTPWIHAKLKLVHYLDSAMCQSCYLQKAVQYRILFQLEEETKNEFCNVFIITPDENVKKKLAIEFYASMLPPTIFVDSTNIFKRVNKNIPSGELYHTFLLDENNNVILVGDPLFNPKIENLLISTVNEKLGKGGQKK